MTLYRYHSSIKYGDILQLSDFRHNQLVNCRVVAYYNLLEKFVVAAESLKMVSFYYVDDNVDGFF